MDTVSKTEQHPQRSPTGRTNNLHRTYWCWQDNAPEWDVSGPQPSGGEWDTQFRDPLTFGSLWWGCLGVHVVSVLSKVLLIVVLYWYIVMILFYCWYCDGFVCMLLLLLLLLLLYSRCICSWIIWSGSCYCYYYYRVLKCDVIILQIFSFEPPNLIMR